MAPILEAQGYEVVLCEYVPRSRVLRLYVDHQAGVSLDDCTRVSRLVSDLLDGEGHSDLFPERYTLEVSSPGLDRPLCKPAHFARFVGREVSVKTHAPRDGGRRRFSGRLGKVVEQGIELECDGRVVVIGFAEIAAARLVPEL